jgi:hypothetical protein
VELTPEQAKRVLTRFSPDADHHMRFHQVCLFGLEEFELHRSNQTCVGEHPVCEDDWRGGFQLVDVD